MKKEEELFPANMWDSNVGQSIMYVNRAIITCDSGALFPLLEPSICHLTQFIY